MSAAIQMRRKHLTTDEQQHVWQALGDDETLAGIAYKIETDAWGGVHMSPTQTQHSRRVRRVARLLEEKLGGEALTELAIVTEDGVKVPDVAWCSEAFLAQHWSDVALLKAPEICVEVVSPSNSKSELRNKTAQYLSLGAREAGLSYPAVRNIIARLEQDGGASLRRVKRGRKAGDGRSLSAEQEQSIRVLVCDQRPEQLKLDFALWNRGAVAVLNERECGIALSVRAVGNYLKRWGFTPQKPIKRAYEKRPEAAKAWRDEPYPVIEAQAEAADGEIHWGDETAWVNTDVRGRGYAPKGKTPGAFSVGGMRAKLSMISSVTDEGKARWMIVEESFNSDNLIEFLAALVKDAERKVFLILDPLPTFDQRSWVPQSCHRDQCSRCAEDT